MAASDKQLADRILQILKTARYTHRHAAMREIDPLREFVGTGDHVERERADAWLAICVLYDALRDPRIRDLDAHWQKAVDKTDAWLATLG